MGNQFNKTQTSNQTKKSTTLSKMVEQALMNSMGMASVSISYREPVMSEFYKGFMRGVVNSAGGSNVIYAGYADYNMYQDKSFDACLFDSDLDVNKALYDEAFKNVLMDDLEVAGVYLGAANLIDINRTLDDCRWVNGIDQAVSVLLDYIQNLQTSAVLTQKMVDVLKGDLAAANGDTP